MIRSLYSSASGMNSQQLNLDVIANNLANVNTTGFKKNKIEFQDLLYQTTRAAGSDQGGGNLLPAGIQIGEGKYTWPFSAMQDGISFARHSALTDDGNNPASTKDLAFRIGKRSTSTCVASSFLGQAMG